MSYLDDIKKKVQQGAQTVQGAVNKGVQTANQAYNTGKQVADKVKEEAPGVINMVQNGVQDGVNKAQDWVQDKVQTVANGVSQAIDFGKEMYNVGKAGYEGAVEGVKDYYSGDSETKAPEQDNTDWASEYDKVMNETTAPTTPSTNSTTPTQNPDGSVTVTQPNGQPINTSPAASATLGEGAGQWQAELDNIMNQIMNREKFSYDMNGDAMYQQYADMFKNQANLGMQNAMGQAAALTGGYGSSYGQMVGQQAYAQQMQGLNDVALDLYDRAYNQYQDEGNQLAQQYAMIADRDQQAYNRAVDERNFNYQKYLDELEQSNYEKELDYRAGRDAIADERYNTEWEANEEQRALDNAYRNDTFAYQKEQDALNNAYRDETFAYQKEQDSLAQKNYEDSFAYQKEQDALAQKNYEDSFAYQKEQDAQAQANWQAELDRYLANDAQAQKNYENEFAYQKEQDALAQKNYEDSFAYQKEQDALAQKNYEDSFAYQKEQDAQSQANWQAEYDREGEWYNDAQEASNPNTTYEGEGPLNGQSVPKQLSGVPGLTTTNTKFFDENGEFKNVSVVRTNEDGTITYNYDGKEVTLKTGTSPYTNTVNPDAKNGVLENGYQPDNVGGVKLGKTNITDIINGVAQDVWMSEENKYWIWDDTQNKYLEYEKAPESPYEKAQELSNLNKLKFIELVK